MLRKSSRKTAGQSCGAFDFTVTFDAPGSYRFSGSKSGTVESGDTVRLKHGESITVWDLPAGTVYRVTESDNTGYRVYARGDTGTIRKNKTAVASFTNAKSSVPITGENNRMLLGLCLMGFAAFGIAGTLLVTHKKRKKTDRPDHR